MCRRIRYTMVEEVLDTAALIAWPMNRMRGCFAVPSQRVELQRIAPEREIVIDSVELQWREPSKNSVTQATEIARLSGDMAGLSETDLSIFALVIEIQAVLVSDDYRLQNLAEKSGLKWISVTTEGIRAMWDWQLICSGCKSVQPIPESTSSGKKEFGDCPDCGARLRIRKKR